MIKWWKVHERELPVRANLILLIQPSLAAAECMFSLLQNCFNERQYSSLEDYIALSVMMQYNKRE